MGIHGMNEVLKRYGVNFAKRSLQEQAAWLRRATQKKDKEVLLMAVDFAQLLFRYNSTATRAAIYRQTRQELIEGVPPEKDGIFRDVFGRFVQDVFSFLQVGLVPVFCLDHPKFKLPQKRETLQKKLEAKERDCETIRVLRERLSSDTRSQEAFERTFGEKKVDEEEKLRRCLTRQVDFLSPEHLDTILSFLYVCGFQLLQAGDEGERLAAKLCQEHRVDVVLTSDTDILPLGARFMLTNTMESNGNERLYTLVSLEDVLEKMNTSYTGFIDLCILLGTDFNERIPGVGPVKACRLWEEGNKTLDNVTSLQGTPQGENLRITWCRRYFLQGVPSLPFRAQLYPCPYYFDKDAAWGTFPPEFSWCRDAYFRALNRWTFPEE